MRSKIMPTTLLLVLIALSVFTTGYLYFEAEGQYHAAKTWEQRTLALQEKFKSLTKQNSDLIAQNELLIEGNKILNEKLIEQSTQIDQLRKDLASKPKPATPVKKPAPKKKKHKWDIAPSQQ